MRADSTAMGPGVNPGPGTGQEGVDGVGLDPALLALTGAGAPGRGPAPPQRTLPLQGARQCHSDASGSFAGQGYGLPGLRPAGVGLLGWELNLGVGNKRYNAIDLQSTQVKLQSRQVRKPRSNIQEDMKGCEWRNSMDMKG